MIRPLNAIRRCLLGLAVLVVATVAVPAESANVQFVGSTAYVYSGSTAILTADRVQNFSSSGFSGTLRMELWAFASPYSGTAQTGYKLAEYSVGQLAGGFYYQNISSGTVPFVLPPTGVWAVSIILTEYDVAPINGGYSPRDYRNYSKLLYVGVPEPADVNFVGSVGYAYAGNTAVLTADRVQNDSASGVSGTLRLELWAFPVPYAGVVLNGYKLSEYVLGTLPAGFGLTNVNSGTIPFAPPPNGTWVATMFVTEYDGASTNGGYSPRDYVNFSNPLVIGGDPTPTAVEYRYPAWDHYFVTAKATDIAALDSGAFPGWVRTGQTFKVWAQPGANLSATCRFFGVGFAPKSSHFYTPFAFECDSVKNDPNWLYEEIAFYLELPQSNGACPLGTTVLYRLYNNFAGGAPNHRYTTSQATFNQMIGLGWTFEGNINTGAFGCVPP